MSQAAEVKSILERPTYLHTILKTLHEVSLLISREPEPNALLCKLPSILVRPEGFKMAWVLMLGPQKTLTSGFFAGESNYPNIYQSFIDEQQLPPCLVPFLNQSTCQLIDPFPAFNPMEPSRILAGYAYPLTVKKSTVGFLVVAFDQCFAQDEFQIHLFEEIGLHVITALQHDQTLQRLRASEEKFRTLFERSADAQLIMKGDVFIEGNDAMARILGAGSKEDLVGLTPWEVSPAKQPDGMNSRTKAFNLINKAENGQSVRFEWVHLSLNDREIPVEVSLTPVSYGSESFIHVAMRDMSDRKKVDKDLQVANQLFQLIMANSPDMIWIRDLDLNLTYLNSAVQRIKGFTQEEAIKIPLKDMATPEFFEMYQNTLIEEFEMDGKPGTNPNRVRRFEADEVCRDGSVIHTETMASFIRDENGNPTGILGITRDISDQQRIFLELAHAKEQAEESDRLKSAFLANMSHEIRTPMNSILGFAELLGDQDLESTERQQYVSIIQSGTSQLLSIISDIIDISKIQAGQVFLHPEPVNLDALFAQILVNFNMDLARHGKSHINLVRNCHCQDCNENILIDLARLNQIMGNLLSNAIKFTQEGTIEFGCAHVQGFIRFFVKDTGKGIAAAHQRVIFERFRQVEESLNRTFTGTGLGLAICQGLVQLMGGEIGVISEPGKGSEFWFTIPYEQESPKL